METAMLTRPTWTCGVFQESSESEDEEPEVKPEHSVPNSDQDADEEADEDEEFGMTP